MRILFDHGTPAPLRHALIGHVVSTAYEMAWIKLDNGALIEAAEKHFDALVTTDKKSAPPAKSRWAATGDSGIADDELASNSRPPTANCRCNRRLAGR